MWAEMKEEVELQLAMLREHVGSIPDLREKVAKAPPDTVETTALGAFLHAFYNGVGNAFKRIAIGMDGRLPRAEGCHQELLTSMAQGSGSRPPAISPDLYASLKDYLDFRHVFRNIYPSWLDWPRTAPLAARCEQTLNRLEQELAVFLKTVRKSG